MRAPHTETRGRARGDDGAHLSTASAASRASRRPARGERLCLAVHRARGDERRRATARRARERRTDDDARERGRALTALGPVGAHRVRARTRGARTSETRERNVSGDVNLKRATRARRLTRGDAPTAKERLRRNREVLESLKVREAVNALATVEPTVRRESAKRPKKEAPAPAEPIRRSARARGESARRGEIGEDDKPADGADGVQHHLTCDEYCALLGIEPGPKMTSFNGWVEESVRIELGIAANSNAAWEQNGGGKFDRRPAKGEQARDHARRMLYKNPNAYFYRHTAGEEQINGDWSESEIERFVEVAKKYGAGDKWGLFASHIPGRVGYQCSAAYRHIILPRGLLRDDAWRMTSSGEAVWVGRR